MNHSDDLLAPQPFTGAKPFRSVAAVTTTTPLSIEMSNSAVFQTASSPISPPSSHYPGGPPPDGHYGPVVGSTAPISPPFKKTAPPPVLPRKSRISIEGPEPQIVPLESPSAEKSSQVEVATKAAPLSPPPALAPKPTLQANSISPAASYVSADLPRMVDAYDEILNGPFAQFMQLSNKIGGDVTEIGALTKKVFDEQRLFLWKACGQPKATQDQTAPMLHGTSAAIEALLNYRNGKRTSTCFNHMSAVSEAIPALGWVTVEPTPAPYVKEMVDASQFYTNRVLKDYKEKDQTHVDWVKAWLQTLNGLHAYVKQHHTTGLVWNSAPGAAPPSADAPKAAPPTGAPPPPPGPPPPPPPPPPVDLLKDNKTTTEGDDDSRAALFADINKGLDITKSLKKVTSDMQTHKNPTLREKSPPTSEKVKPPPIAPKPSHLTNGVTAAAKPEPTPKCELEGGKKWVVEHFKNNNQVVVNVENMKQVVYIYKCNNSVVQIKGKANSITMDSCKKTSVVFDGLVSSIELINCQSAQVQTLGAMPTLTIQKTDGCQVYLSKDALESEIVSSQSSSMNILVPDESGEFGEFNVPEQYKTVWNGKTLVTSAVGDMG